MTSPLNKSSLRDTSDIAELGDLLATSSVSFERRQANRYRVDYGPLTLASAAIQKRAIYHLEYSQQSKRGAFASIRLIQARSDAENRSDDQEGYCLPARVGTPPALRERGAGHGEMSTGAGAGSESASGDSPSPYC